MADSYNANPYAFWERGIHEITDGLLRQFFPEGTDIKAVTHKEINRAVKLLNNRPRKTRKYKTPNQIFKNEFIPLV